MENNYPTGFYFKLSFKGEDAAFQEASDFTKTLSVEDISSTEENHPKSRFPTSAKIQNLTLKRGLIPTGSQLMDWCATTLNGSLGEVIECHDLQLKLLQADGTVINGWTFSKAYPVKYTISELKSQEDGLVVEHIEFAYSFFSLDL